jgi:hypothetical protein
MKETIAGKGATAAYEEKGLSPEFEQKSCFLTRSFWSSLSF